MRYAESDALLEEALISEAHLVPVDEYLASARMDWPLTAKAVAQHTGTPEKKVLLVFERLVREGWFTATETVVCPDEHCNFMNEREDVQSARDNKDECPCVGCSRDLAAESEVDVVQMFTSAGQPQDNDA